MIPFIVIGGALVIIMIALVIYVTVVQHTKVIETERAQMREEPKVLITTTDDIVKAFGHPNIIVKLKGENEKWVFYKSLAMDGERLSKGNNTIVFEVEGHIVKDIYMRAE